jgi:hypothetical protein
MNKMFGITNIRVKIFSLTNSDQTDHLNHFLEQYNGNVIDIQFQDRLRVMVVYQEVKTNE